MTAPVRNSSSRSTADSELLRGVHVVLDDLATSLVAKLNALVVKQFASRKEGSKALEKQLAEAVPSYLEQAFVAGFLDDKQAARQRRVLLAHLLTTADLQSVSREAAIASFPPAEKHPPSQAAGGSDDDELTSEAAAKLLHVSRTHLNTLVESGALGEVRRTAGGHRRISKSAVLEYKEKSKARQAKGLDEMMEASRRLGLYDVELANIPVRRKR